MKITRASYVCTTRPLLLHMSYPGTYIPIHTYIHQVHTYTHLNLIGSTGQTPHPIMPSRFFNKALFPAPIRPAMSQTIKEAKRVRKKPISIQRPDVANTTTGREGGVHLVMVAHSTTYSVLRIRGYVPTYLSLQCRCHNSSWRIRQWTMARGKGRFYSDVSSLSIGNQTPVYCQDGGWGEAGMVCFLCLFVVLELRYGVDGRNNNRVETRLYGREWSIGDGVITGHWM